MKTRLWLRACAWLLALICLAAPDAISRHMPADIAAAAAASGPPPPLKIIVEEDGLIELTGADLAAAGWILDVLDPAALHLTVAGQEVALWTSAGAAPFQADDVLLFYGQAAADRYGPRNVYWLTAGDGPGLRMAERDVAPVNGDPVAAWWPATLHAEQDIAPWGYWQNPPGREAQDHWYWTAPLNAPAQADLSFEMPPCEPTAGPFTLRVALVGRTDAIGPQPDHHTRVLLNGRLLDDAHWDGQIQFVHTAVFTPSLVAAGANTVTVLAVGDTGVAADSIYVNWIEVDYAARYVAQGDRLVFGVNPSPTGGGGLLPSPPSLAGKGAGGLGVTSPPPPPLPGEGSISPPSLAGKGAGGLGHSAHQTTSAFLLAGFRSADIEIYDISDPRRPARLRNAAIAAEPGEDGRPSSFSARFEDQAPADARYLALTAAARRRPAAIRPAALADLRNPNNAADELVVVYDEWFDEVEPLVARRRAQGWRVQAVRIGEVYDAFGWGRETPHALRDLLGYARRSWQTPPTHVLLIGDANLDYRDRFGTGRPNFIPTFIFDAADVGETASDAWFVQLAGDDAIPEMAIGRLPAISAADARAMIAKILRYETAAGGLWQSRMLFVADGVAAHRSVAEGWLAQLPAAYLPQRVFASAYPPGDPTADIVAALDRGVGLVSYIGHGNIDRWGVWSGGRLFDVTTIGRLANADRLPFVVTADCLNGFFVHPYTDATIAEALLRKADGGAVAVWSSSSLGAAGDQAILFAHLFRELTAEAPPTVGQAIARATAAAARAGVSPELLPTFILFGDPALRLRLAPAARQNLPLIVAPSR